MTDQERIKSILSEIEYDYIGYDNLHGDEGQGLRVIKETLGKQIPKTPRLVNRWNWTEDFSCTFECPVCGEFVGDEYDVEDKTYKYCYKCGQAIDWSDEE